MGGRFGRDNFPQAPIIDPASGEAKIPLFRVDGSHVYVVLDAIDLDIVAGYRWWEARRADGLTSYAHATTGYLTDRRAVIMHRLLTDAPVGLMVDHRDGDGLNNRRSNIRVATASQNGGNKVNRKPSSSPYRGTHWIEKEQAWRAYIGADGRLVYLGSFDDAISAALTYDDAARERWGEFARPNFTEEEAASLSRSPRRKRLSPHGLSRYIRRKCRCATCSAAYRSHRDNENAKARDKRAGRRAA